MEAPDEEDLNNNLHIMSREIAMGSRSFINKRQSYMKNAPPPKYLTKEQLTIDFDKLPTKKDEILYGFDYPENGGLICTD